MRTSVPTRRKKAHKGYKISEMKPLTSTHSKVGVPLTLLHS